MNNFRNLDTYLTQSFHPDYWSDEALPYATSLINSLNKEDWDQLVSTWPSRTVSWQVRLAEALYGSERPQATSLLVNMLQATEQAVAVAASESLEAKDYIWKPNLSLKNTLQRISKQLEGYEKQTVIKLLERIP